MDKTAAGERIRQWQERTHQEQQDLARDLGISDGHLSRLLTGERGPSLPLAVRIERLTGVPVAMWSVVDEPEERSVRS